MTKWKNIIFSAIFLFLLIVSATIRFQQSANFQFPFTYDQSRDMLNIRIPGTFRDLPLVGPTTSINGVMLGPGYYYFNLPAFWIFGGSPQGLVYWNIIWFLLGAGAIFLFFFKKEIELGLIITIIYLFAPQLFDTTRYFWNAHAMIYAAVFFFLAIANYLKKINKISSLLLGISVGVAMHFEAAFALVMLLCAGILVLSKRDGKSLKWFLVGSLPWFLPQIVFEISKGFIMSKLLVTEFSQSGGILGDKLNIIETIKSHWQSILMYFEGQFILPMNFGKLILVLGVIGGLLVKKYRKLTINLLLFLGFTFLFYISVYHHELKKWYLESLRVWYIFMVGIGMAGWYLWFKKRKVILVIYLFLLIVFLGRTIYLTAIDQKQFINNPSFAKDDPKLMEHVIKSVDWIYQKTENKGFYAYNYVPEIYDYPYQYVYWWWGKKMHGYMPETVSYLPNVPEYLPRQNQYYEKSKKSEQIIGLIYERKSNYEEWLKKFDQYCVEEKVDFEWQVSAEIRVKCK